MDPVHAPTITRRATPLVSSRLADEPVVLLEGPRSVGKSTVLRSLAAEHGSDLIDLDDPATKDAVTADPSLFLNGTSPVCVDEYQKAPLVLDMIKAELNRSTRPGRYLLAGSTRYETLPEAAQSLTGRLHRIPIYPFTQAEIENAPGELISRLLQDPNGTIPGPRSQTSRDDYIRRVVRGGFPLAIERSPQARGRWFDDYVQLTLKRDVLELSKLRQAADLPRLLQRLAGQTAQILNLAAVERDIGLAPATTHAYTAILEAVFLIQQLPAWGRTLGSRAAAKPKLHVVDSGIAARLLRLTPERLQSRDPSALTEFGHLLETFVVGEVIRHVSWMDDIVGLGHHRTHDGDEVDLVVERGDGRIVAFEVKTGSRVPGDQFGPLRRLRGRLGDRFIAGIAFYLGERAYTLEDRLHVLPVDRLWSPSSTG